MMQKRTHINAQGAPSQGESSRGENTQETPERNESAQGTLINAEPAYLLELAHKLIQTRSLSLEEYETLIAFHNQEVSDFLAAKARQIREDIYGTSVFIRGLI